MQPNNEHNFSTFDVVIKALPVLAALATAVLSLWRDSSKRRPHSPFGKTVTDWWKRIGTSGRALVVLAAATCAIGIYSGIEDLQENDALRASLRATQHTLDDTKITLSSQLHDAEAKTMIAEKETITEAKAAADRLKKIADTHAAESKKQQELTFVSLLSSVTEPAHGIVELDLSNPIPGSWGGKIDLVRPSVAEYLAKDNDENWRYSLMFEPIFRSIKWSDPDPISWDAYLGRWPKHDEHNENRSWGARVDVQDKKEPPSTEAIGSVELREYRHLIIRLPPLVGQSMLDLWRGPDEKTLGLDIWIQLHDLPDEATRRRVESLARKTITKVTAYYSISAKAGLCMNAELKLSRIHAASNQLRIQYSGTDKIDRISCPAYVISPQDSY